MTKKNELEELISLAKIVSKPWQIATWVLSGLLSVSIFANVYLFSQENEIIVEQDYNTNALFN